LYHQATVPAPEVNSTLRWGVAVFVGMVLLFVADAKYPPIAENDVFGLCVALMLANCGLALGVLWVRGMRDRAAQWKKLVMAITLASCAQGICVYLNGRWDRAQAISKSLTIQEKRVIRGGRSTAYEITIESWRGQGQADRLTVSHEVFQNHQIGERLALRIHPGALGLAWYEHPRQ
jgi:hypothetical protein